jgi:hypothetical protein
MRFLIHFWALKRALTSHKPGPDLGNPDKMNRRRAERTSTSNKRVGLSLVVSPIITMLPIIEKAAK